MVKDNVTINQLVFSLRRCVWWIKVRSKTNENTTLEEGNVDSASDVVVETVIND